MVESKKKAIAPDGGWGWVVVIGFAVSNVISIPVLQGFALLFRNVFIDLNLSAIDISTIINVNSGFGMLLGLMNGPLLKAYGFRWHAIIGSLIMFVGFICTSQATSFYEFLLFYGAINSVGFSMSMAAFSLAMNTYFKEKRAMAAGITSTLTGLGPVVMPLLISRFVDIFGARGTALILSGLLLNCFASALLLQPIKWHYKYVSEENIVSKEMQLLNTPLITKESDGECNKVKDHEEAAQKEEIEQFDSQIGHSIEDVMVPKRVSDSTARRSISHSRLSLYEKDKVEPESTWWKKSSNFEEGLFQETNVHIVQPSKSKSKWYHKVIKFFDLDLLKDPIYTNIWIGMSIAFTGEINFSLMTPVILGERNFSIEETARIMSVIASSDIIFRFISPFVGNWLKLPARQMYMMSLMMLIISRFALTFVYSYWDVLIVGLALGIAKGFRTVYMSLVIPNHVPLEKLPSASGLQTVLNGILLLTFGPIVGLAKDYFGNYNVVIHFINCLSFTTVLLWSIEMIVVYQKSKTNEES
ncbi:monocarboxylate transporter 9-like isoform X2 [Cimex lectularius]|uniref:Monocarboxylate transporter n=1 Tax=Cimex lectularius TaxID=79782 RepID=A0A8I6S307_CIMLE|nr:monocarboxylate transporter 9-like isoform X2 [Cimex lectularius]